MIFLFFWQNLLYKMAKLTIMENLESNTFFVAQPWWVVYLKSSLSTYGNCTSCSAAQCHYYWMNYVGQSTIVFSNRELVWFASCCSWKLFVRNASYSPSHMAYPKDQLPHPLPCGSYTPYLKGYFLHSESVLWHVQFYKSSLIWALQLTKRSIDDSN